MNVENNESKWWSRLSAEQKVIVNLVGKYDRAGLDQLSGDERVREAIRRSNAAINNIMNYILDNPELFPSISGYEDFDILDMLHSIFLELTPAEIEQIHQADVTNYIIPDAKFNVELLKRRDQ